MPVPVKVSVRHQMEAAVTISSMSNPNAPNR